MHSHVFVEFRFWLLVFLSVVVPAWMFLMQRRKRHPGQVFILLFGLALIAISCADVWLLQALAVASRATPSLLDDKLFNSGMSLALYVFPVLYGGIGLNLISHGLLAHLVPAQVRSEWRLREPDPSLQRVWLSPIAAAELLSASRETHGPQARAPLPLEIPSALDRRVAALLSRLHAGVRTAQMPLRDLFSPAFMVTHTRFGAIEDMLEAGGFIEPMQALSDAPVRKPWDAFVRSSTQFKGWEQMLESACCHWLANKLLVERIGPRRSPAAITSNPSITFLQPQDPPSYDWLAAMPRAMGASRR